MNKRIYLTIVILLIWQPALGQICEEIFPDAVSSANNSGEIIFGNNSRVIGSPDNILDTRNLNDSSGGVSCDGAPCSASNAIVDESDFNSFPNNQPDISVGFQQTQTISPGNYGGLTLSSEATLNMEPGVYAFRDDVVIGFDAEIVVTAPGTVILYARQEVNVRSEAVINDLAGTRYFFLFARQDITFNARAIFNGVVFSRQEIELFNGAIITGAVTARQDINLRSASTIVYDADVVSDTDFDTWCTSNNVPLPQLIAEWRLDELSWNGSANEVQDNSGNGLHGSAVEFNGSGFPNTDISNPVVSGSPGTCSYGDFNGTADGYVEIPDPGINSILDLDDEFSVTVWVNARSWATSGLATIVSKDENFEFHLNGSGRINWWWGGGNRSLTSSQSVPLNEWHHIAITYRSGEQHIYLDGVSIANNNSTQAITLNNDSVFIGTDWNLHSRRFNGLIDEVRIYGGALTEAQVQQVMNETHDCVLGTTLDRFDIDVGSGNGSVCAPQAITISARDASDSVMPGYTGTIDITTSTGNGDWEIGTASDALGNLVAGSTDSGSASYTFEQSGLDEGVITIELNNQHAETLTISVNDSSEGVSSSSSTLTFSENAFAINENDNLDYDVIAGRPHGFVALMLRREPGASECGVATNYNESSVRAWVSRGASDAGGAAPVINNALGTDTANLQSTELASEGIDLNFSSGVATFSLATADVGQYSVQLYDDTLNFSDQPIRGGSQTLVVRPFAFDVSVAGNPGATDANGDVFQAAGEAFDVTIRALGWHTLDDNDENSGAGDGQPDTYQDSGANPSDDDQFNGAVLPSFGLEPTPATLTLSSSLLAPSGGTASGLGSAGSPPILASGFSAGTTSVDDLYYPEVGIIQIDAALSANYLGATSSALSDSKSAPVGRFIPSYFALTISNFDSACGSFSYLQQPRPIELALEAMNARDERTQNYRDTFAKLDGSALSRFSFGAVDSVLPTELTTRLSVNSESYVWTSGILAYSAALTVERLAATLEAPFTELNIGATATDSDSVTIEMPNLDLDTDGDSSNDFIRLGEDEYRFGRLVLPNAHGPESADLLANFNTQYWNRTGWLQNEDDSCTEIAAADISLPPNRAIDTPSNLTTSLGAGSSTAMFGDFTAGLVNFTGGDAGLYFTAPGAGNTGTINVDVDLSNYAWLRFDWNQDGDYSDTALPTAEFTFGSYRGHDRIIYWQEVLTN